MKNMFVPKMFLRVLLVACLMTTACFGSATPIAHAQRVLYLAAPFFYGNVQHVTPEDRYVYGTTQRFISFLNSRNETPYIYPNPQLGTQNDLGTWVVDNNVDIAFLPFPLYAAMKNVNVNVAEELTPVAFLPSVESVMIGNEAACNPAVPLSDLLDKGLLITETDYQPNGVLLARRFLSQLGAQPKDTYSGETLALVEDRFLTEAQKSDPVFLLTTKTQADLLLPHVKNACYIKTHIPVPWPAFVLVINKNIPKDEHDAFLSGLKAVSENRNAFFSGPPAAPTGLGDLPLRIQDFTLLDKSNINLLEDPLKAIEKEGLETRPFFNISQLMLRYQDWSKNGLVAMVLPPAGAKSAYGFGAASALSARFYAAGEQKNVMMVGSSGGAVGSLILSLTPNFQDLDEASRAKVLDPTQSLKPAIRFKILTNIIRYWYLFLPWILFLMSMFLYTPVLIWRTAKKRRDQLMRFVLVIFAFVTLFFFSPPINLEIGGYLTAGLSAILILLFLASWKKTKLFPVVDVLAVVILLITLISLRTFVLRNSILDELDIRPMLHATAAADPSLSECNSIKTDDPFFTCLVKHLKFSIVISTSDLLHQREVFFYYKADGAATFEIPRSGKWVDLKTCPENLAKVVEGSASFPIVFPPVLVTCDGEDYYLGDGSIFSSGTSNVATQIGAATAITFLNRPFKLQEYRSQNPTTFDQTNLFSFLYDEVNVVFGRNLYHDFQSNLVYLRQIIFTPTNNTFLPSDFDYYGVENKGVFYSQAEIYKVGKREAENPKGQFVQVSGSRFDFDAFAKLVAKQNSSSTSATPW